MGVGSPAETRFEFGENWRKFAAVVDEARVAEAERSLQAMLGVERLDGRSFLDVGCGSGLFSLAAARLGAAPIRSFDYDAGSVDATLAVKERFLPDASGWTVEHGDATDAAYIASLGSFDVVYAWGVLHHTGAMWQALDNVSRAVRPGGMLFLAIYNDQGQRSAAWRVVKRIYNRLPRALRTPYAVAVILPFEARSAARAALERNIRGYVRRWTCWEKRGMSRWHDIVDWVGGYPFEVATPDEVAAFCGARGYELVRLTDVGGGIGCNEFVLRRAAERHEAA